MGQLTNLFVSESYQGLIKLANSTTGVTENLQYLQDGLGNNLPIQVSLTEVTITGSISNAVSSSYSNFAVSSSEATHAVSASYAPSNPLPSGIVSGSSQISYTGITDVPSGIISGSSQIEGLGYATTSSLTTLSSSIAVTDLAQDGRLSSLEINSGSQQLEINQKLNSSSFNSYTSSNDSRVNSLESKTGSYATTGSNVFQGTQTVTGSLNVTGEITALSASITYLKTIYQTSSIVYSSGSNILGDEASDVQTLNGTVNIPLGNVNVTGAVTASAGFKGNLEGTASYATQALSASWAPDTTNTGSFATTGSNQFNGDQSISGSVTLSGSINNVNYIDFNTGSTVPAWKSGRVFWDNTDGALSVYNAEADISLQVGQEQWVRVRNNTGVPIVNGAAVRLIGALGDNPLIVLAQSVQMSGSINTDNQILGIATHTIETGTDGYVTTLGNVRGLNTSAYNEGDVLFVSSSAGLLTKVVPVAPYERIPVATVVKVGPGGSGIIYVAPVPPIDFTNLSTVEISGSYSQGDIWNYDGNVWKHRQPSSIGLATTSSLTTLSSSIAVTDLAQNNRLGSIEGKTGSYATTGSNTFIGNQIVNGTVTQNVGSPDVDTQRDFITVSGASIGGKSYDYVNQGLVNYPGFGENYENSFLTEYYDSLSYNYGTEFLQNGKRIAATVIASGSGQVAAFSVRDLGNETTSFNMYADDIQIGEYGPGTSTRIGIGHNDLPNLYLKAQTINLSGSLDVVGDVGVNGSVGSKRFNFNGNPFNTNVGGTFGSINYDATNTSLSIINNDFSTPATRSAVYATTNTGSNLTNVSMVADYAGTSAELKVQNSNGTRNVNVQTDTMTVTGSLEVSNGVTGSFRGDGSGLTGITTTLPSGVVSGSAQVSAFGFAITGSNTFIGNQIINGSSTQNIGTPGVDSQTDFITVSGSTIEGKQYNYVNSGFVNYPGYGIGYADTFLIEYYSSLGYEYGAELQVNGRKVGANLYASGSGQAAAFSLRDVGNETTSFNVYADDIQIGEYGAGTTTRVGIGHTALPNLYLKGQTINISGSTHMYSSDAFPLYVDGTINSKRLHFTGNPFNTDVAPNLGALRFDGTNTQFYLTNYDNTNLATQSIVGTVVQTGSNLVQTFLGSNNNNFNAYLRLTNDAGVGSLSTNVDVVVTGSLSVSNTLKSNYSSGDEGGEIQLALPQTSTTLTGSITMDVNGNKVRIFESGGTNRGGYFDISTLSPSVGTNLGAGGGSVPSGTISGSAQIAALGYAITGSNTFNGSQIVTGSLSGNVGSLSITSNTASMDTNTANFFTLTLPDAATHILPSNIKPGQTVNVKVVGGLTSTVTFPTSVKQPSGSLYVPTVSGTDILTFVSFDGTDIYMANVKKLI